MRTKSAHHAPALGRTLSRRSILGGAATIAAAGALPLSTFVSRAGASAARKEVLVLGAGMAGLTAALALSRRGHKVTVIEYQNRVGGRLLSLSLKNGQHSEAGGGHFRSNMPYVLSYIRHFKLPILSLNDALPRYLIDGKTCTGADLADWPMPLNRDERGVAISSTLNRYLTQAGFDTDTVLDARWPDADTIARFDDMTAEDLIKSVGASDEFCKLVNVHEGNSFLQTPAIALLPTLAYHLGDKNLFRIRGGNQRLPEAMANAIGRANVILGAPVTAIDQSGPRVRVAVKDGREFTGDMVISTIPFSVLGDVKMTPAWTPAKRRMIEETRWGNTVKVAVQTRSPAWLKKGVFGWPMAASDRPWERVIDITGNEPGGNGNVFFYLNGANAESILKRPAADRAQVVLDMFRADMPDLFDEVVMSETFAWPEQPWIKASFPGMPLGGGWMIREWSEPEGRIHFAGDATSLKAGWVEGAIESGLRAARRIDREAPAEGHPRIRQEI